MKSVSDKDWFGIREAVRRRDWANVAQRADALNWLLVAKHARRCQFNSESLPIIIFALRLDQPDEPDPFAADG